MSIPSSAERNPLRIIILGTDHEVQCHDQGLKVLITEIVDEIA
jgi:hypothetical protein